MAENSTKTAKRRAPGRPFKRGQSGNPGGRPKTADFSLMVREYLGNHGPNRKSHLLSLIERLYVEDPKTLLYYAFGKPVETVNTEITGNVGVDMRLVAAARELAKTL